MLTLAANVNNNIPGVGANDLYLDADDNITLSFDLQAVLEACSQAAKTILGEMIFNINQGIPYFETVWIGVPNIQQFSAALRAAFLTVPNVIEVISLITSQENNTLTYSAIIRTTFGAGNVIGSV
jgi:hypothetical protein